MLHAPPLLSLVSSPYALAIQETILHLSSRPIEKLTVEEMRDLISHDSPVNQQILNLYLHLLSNQYDATFLDTGFFSLLKDHGWSRVSSWFALQAPQFCARSNSCPLLTTESVISIHSLPRLQQPLGCCHKEGDLWFSVLPLCQ